MSLAPVPAEDESFPFRLTICRPSVAGLEGLPFAEVVYKKQRHLVVQWPYLLPFQLSSGHLTVRVFLAEDEGAFLQLRREALGCGEVSLESLESCAQEMQELVLPLSCGASVRVLAQRRARLLAAAWALSVAERDAAVFEAASPAEPREVWKEKYEKQKEAVEALRKEHAEILEGLQAEKARSRAKSTAAAELTGRILWRAVADVVLLAWAQWVAQEKSQRQFIQLSEDAQIFQASSTEERHLAQQKLRQLQRDKDGAFCEEAKLQELWSLRLDAWGRRLGPGTGRDRELAALHFSWGAWRLRVRRHLKLWPLAGKEALTLLFRHLQAWRLCAASGRRRHQALALAEAELAALAAARLRAAEALESLDWRWHQRAALEQWQALLLDRRSAQFLRFALGCAAQRAAGAVLGVFLCRWHSVCLGRREAKVAAERAARRSAWRRRRRSTAQALEAPAGWWLAGFLAFVLQQWRDGARQARIQQVLEEQLQSREAAQSQLSESQRELQGLQAAKRQEEGAWANERSDLLERLQHLRAEQRSARDQLQAILARRSQLVWPNWPT
ncbi:unnamed protein product [Effrenium voratum]|uniref:Uncharacterized protein n=1 Tax=Effrenium voratum TaxID=2562239 RepID=A0AA36JAP5_9DINO|nr:unnamed protein product [Effrenium voratum]